MDVRTYLARRRERESAPVAAARALCRACLQPESWCYCAGLRPFDPQITFVILQHFLELRRTIATGRMAHLCLESSRLLLGHDYSEDPAVEALLADPSYQPVVLLPSPGAAAIDEMDAPARAGVFATDRRPLVFVVDGTWSTAKKTVRLSRNLRDLPRIRFTPDRPSTFRLRRQPQEKCWSTIEAIHRTIELLGADRGFDVSARAHDVLLSTFDAFVERRLAHVASLEKLNPRQRKGRHALRSSRER